MFDYVANLYSFIALLIGLTLCFSYSLTHARREYQLLTGFLLGDFLSSYYWSSFMLVMGTDPEASEFLAYLGWNIGYVLILLLARRLQTNEERRFFHPLMLVPIPLNIAQFLLYIRYGAYFNNAWQGIFCTLTAVTCLQSILYRRAQKTQPEKKMPVFLCILLYIILEYAMFTSTCFSWPSDALDPYFYTSFACYTIKILLPLSLAKAFGDHIRLREKTEENDFKNALKILFIVLVIGISLGGIVLAMWMKSLIDVNTGGIPADNTSGVIMVMLFVVSVIISVMVIAVLIAISFGEKSVVSISDKDLSPERSKKNAAATVSPEDNETPAEHTDAPADKRAVIRRWNLILPLLITFLLMMLVVFYTSRLLYRISVENAHESAADKAQSTAVYLENYLHTARSVLLVTADSVDYMLANGRSNSHILYYLIQETENQTDQFDENYTGLYGLVRGQYLDGAGWEPPADYDPTTRDWYLAAINAGGEVTIATPYLDAQTGSMVVSICKALDDGQSGALSLDLVTARIQTVVEETDVSGKGYCFVLSDDGTVIAHKDMAMNGQDIYEMSYGAELMQKIADMEDGSFEIILDDQEYTLFIDRVMDRWTIILAISNRELYADVTRTLAVNIVTFLIVFLLIAFFYSVAYRNEERSNREAEALKIREQQRSYEAEILRLEKSAADAANKAKSSFLADMSHEIRTPINAVLGMNEMILRETTDESIRTYAGNVESAGKNLLSIINDILDFSKIEAGKMEITDAPYQLSSVLNDVSNMIMFRARAKDLAFHVKVDETIPDELYGDEVRVRQVVTNILTNAVKYTREGSVTLDVRAVPRPDLMREEDAGDPNALKGFIDLIVAVTDTGIGIKEEDRARLFEKFGRVDLQQTNTIEGTGLGLAITGNLLGLMHGDISVESTYGKGSTFTVRLPQGVVSTDAIGDFHRKFEQGLRDRKAYQESFRAPEAHVLVVDDTRMNLTVMKGLLKKTEVQVETADGGETALAATMKTPFDLILLDQRMPGMDGTDVLHHIRAQEGGCNLETPVICLTADAVQGARERYLSEGFNDYLSKPVEATALEATLLKYLPENKVVRAEM